MTTLNQDFTTYQGNAIAPIFTIKTPAGAVVDLSTASDITWTARRGFGTADVLAKTKTGGGITFPTNGTDGQFQVIISKTDTAALSGAYFYEASVVDAGGNPTTVATGQMQIALTSFPAPGINDLTTLAAVKSWIKATGAVDDGLLQRLITSLSRSALTWANRDSFYGRTVSALLDPTQVGWLVLPEYPVTSVSALATLGGAIPAATAPTPGLPNQPAGYLLEPWNGIPPGGAQKLTLYGYGFVRGAGGAQATYRVGYEVLGEAQTIPATSDYTIAPTAPYGPAMADSGVVKASDGTAFVRKAATPTAGQYTFTQDATTGLWGYTFAAADTGIAVLLSYSFAPADVAQALTEWVCERYKYRDRMGETSRTLQGQQTAAYDTSALPKYVTEILNQYRATGPLF